MDLENPTAEDLITWLYQCKTCGKEHEYLPVSKSGFMNMRTWADPDDGHAFVRRMNWLEGDLRTIWRLFLEEQKELQNAQSDSTTTSSSVQG